MSRATWCWPLRPRLANGSCRSPPGIRPSWAASIRLTTSETEVCPLLAARSSALASSSGTATDIQYGRGVALDTEPGPGIASLTAC